MLIGLIGAAVPLGLIYSLYNYALNYIVERFTVLSGFLNFLSVDEVFHFLIPDLWESVWASVSGKHIHRQKTSARIMK